MTIEIKAIKEEYLAVLRANIENNVEKYIKGEKFAEELFKQNINDIFTEIDVPEEYKNIEMALSNEKSDAVNAKALYEGLKFLTPVQAADEKIWVYLTHFAFYEYSSKRIGAIEDGDDENLLFELDEKQIKKYNEMIERRLFIGKDSHPIGRNILSRLWWSAHIVYDEKRENPYELINIMFSDFAITWGILGRNLYNNKTIARGVLLALKELSERGIKVEREQIFHINKSLNTEGGIKILDVLSEEEIKNIVLSKIKKQP